LDANSFKTVSLNRAAAKKDWIIVDADHQILGRMASEVSKMIRGKHKPSFTPHMDCGDNVIVINADKIRLTGKKWTNKEYVRHTGYPGGRRVETPNTLKAKSSARIIEKAVKGMLPKNRLGRQLFKNLHVYEGVEHPHKAQKPKEIKF